MQCLTFFNNNIINNQHFYKLKMMEKNNIFYFYMYIVMLECMSQYCVIVFELFGYFILLFSSYINWINTIKFYLKQ